MYAKGVIIALTLAGVAFHEFIGKNGNVYIKRGKSGGRKGETFFFDGWFR